jgi:hypothetical protein
MAYLLNPGIWPSATCIRPYHTQGRLIAVAGVSSGTHDGSVDVGSNSGRQAVREVAVLGGQDFIYSQRSGVQEDLFKVWGCLHYSQRELYGALCAYSQ